MKSPVEQLPRRACAAGLTDSRASRASRATRGDARAARHSPWHAVQCHCSLVNAAHRTSRLLTRQHIVLHRQAAEAVALRRRLPVLSTEQAHGSMALHQLQEVRTSQWKHQMLPHHPQLCAAQRTGHATQS